MTEKRIYEMKYVEGLVAENSDLREVAEAAEQHVELPENLARQIKLCKKLYKWQKISDDTE